VANRKKVKNHVRPNEKPKAPFSQIGPDVSCGASVREQDPRLRDQPGGTEPKKGLRATQQIVSGENKKKCLLAPNPAKGGGTEVILTQRAEVTANGAQSESH